MSLDSRKEKKPAKCSNGPNAQKNPPQLLKETAAFRCVQAWLLEKPTAWADDPCLAAAKAAEEVISLSMGSKSALSRKREKNESSGSFFARAHLRACARISPSCATRRRRILFSSTRSLARSRSLSMISLRPPIRRRRFLFSRSRSKPRSISSRSSSSRPAMRARWCERSASSSASSRGRLRSKQPQGRERPRPPTRRASPGAMPARTGRPLRKSSL